MRLCVTIMTILVFCVKGKRVLVLAMKVGDT